MHPQLARLADDYDSARERVRKLRRIVPVESWTRRPAAESWSPAECIAHLNLTSSAFAPLLREGLAEARRLGTPAPLRYHRDFWGWFVATLSGPSRLLRTRTRPAFVPAGELVVDELVRAFERLQDDHLTCLRSADGLPIHRVRIRSPFEARIQYTLFSAFSLIPGHQHRHLAQAEAAVRP